jgi:hypothetical protein
MAPVEQFGGDVAASVARDTEHNDPGHGSPSSEALEQVVQAPGAAVPGT